MDARDPTPLAAAADELYERARRVGPDAAVVAIAGDVADDAHRGVLMGAVDELGGLDALVHNAGILGPSPQPGLAHYPPPPRRPRPRLRRQRDGAPGTDPAGPAPTAAGGLRGGGHLRRRGAGLPGLGGYGSSKAALEQLSAVLAVEQPELRVYRVDPGDMRTRMQAEALPRRGPVGLTPARGQRARAAGAAPRCAAQRPLLGP